MDLLFLRSGSTGRQGCRVTHNPYWPSSIAGAEALLRSVHSGLVWVGRKLQTARKPAPPPVGCANFGSIRGLDGTVLIHFRALDREMRMIARKREPKPDEGKRRRERSVGPA